MPLLLALVLGLLALAYTLAPLFRSRPGSAVATVRLRDAIAHADEAKQALRDVEFDHQLGNLGAGDYAELRGAYERRALTALKTRYEREQALDALLDRELAAVRARIASEAAEHDREGAAETAPEEKPSTEARALKSRPSAPPPGRPASRGPRARRKGV